MPAIGRILASLLLLSAPWSPTEAQGDDAAQVLWAAQAPGADRPSRLAEAPARLEVSAVPLGTALILLQKNSGVPLVYSPAFLPLSRAVTCVCQESTVGEAAMILLRGLPFELVEIENHLIIREVKRSTVLAHLASLDGVPPGLQSESRSMLPRMRRAPALQGTIVGTVVNGSTGQPLSAAQVFIANGAGTLTGGDGRFRLANVPAGKHEVRVQLIGFRAETQEVTVRSGEVVTMNFRLQEQALALDALVVTGTAGRARQREVGNSIAQLNASSVPEPVVTTDQLIGGRAPGVSVLQNSGVLGGGAQIRLRGNGSATMSNQPLIYVDGVRIQSMGPPKNAPHTRCDCESNNDTPSPLNDINPADIERMEVIRGPAATTLYGTEAAAGVIQIFTKRGTQGAPVWRVQSTTGMNWVRPFGSEAQPYLGRPELGLGLDRFLREAWTNTTSLSVSGGTGDVQYYLSGSMDANEGVMPNDEQRKGMIRGNVTFRPTESLLVEWKSRLTTDRITNTAAGTNIHGITANVFRAPNNFLGSGELDDLLETLRFDIGWDNTHSVVGLTTTYVGSDWFTSRGTIGYDRYDSRMTQAKPFDFRFEPGGSKLEKNWIHETLTLDYSSTLSFGLREGLNTDLSVGAQGVWTDERSLEVFGTGFPGPGDYTVTGAGGQASYAQEMRVVNGGFFVQNVLGYLDRYFLTLGLRVDGNSAFGSDFGLQPYPKISGSYVISDETFWPEAFGQVKLRAAYGQAGRAPGAFDAVRTWSPEGWGTRPAFVPANVGNADLGPERTGELELGFDAALLDDRLSLDFTYYDQKTEDALFQVRQVPSQGFLGSQLRNTGEIRNRGIEIAAQGTILDRPDFGLELGADIGTNKSEVLSLGDAPPFSLGWFSWIEEGYPVIAMRGVRITNPDEYADPVLESNYIFGPNHPTLSVGMHSDLRFGQGIRLSLRGEYHGGHYIYDHLSARSGVSASTWVVCEDANAYERIAAGDVADLNARMRAMCGDQKRRDMFMFRGDFFKMRWLTLQLPVPPKWVPGGNAATVTLAGRNFFTWRRDPFLKADPEMGGDGGLRQDVRVIGENVPAPARISASFQVTF